MLKLYNSFGRKLQTFQPLLAGQVGLYTCGPTLYDWQHIGNLRTFLLTDSLRRILELSAYKVTNIMNVTDVEDKIIAQLGDQPLEAFTAKYFTALKADMNKLNISQPTWVRATDPESIQQMAKLIERIMKQGLAYESEGSIYLSVNKYSQHHQYGVLQPIDAKSLKSTGRIEADDYDKKSVQDFALWKAQKPGEPAWTISVDGKKFIGRPGWHIECSAMSELELGKQFDIHLGGVDLLFPHHENEIAQSQAANHQLLAHFWLHGEMLQVEGQKMSKSLGNIVKLQDIADRGFEPLALRLLFLQAHYRTQMNFTWESLGAAQQNLKSIRAFADQRFQPNSEAKILDSQYLKSARQSILAKLQDDIGTPQALSELNKMINHIEKVGEGVHPKDKSEFNDFLKWLDKALGLELLTSADITDSQRQLIDKREVARQQNNWAESDKLRDQLAEQGVEIKDTSAGPIWQRL